MKRTFTNEGTGRSNDGAVYTPPAPPATDLRLWSAVLTEGTWLVTYENADGGGTVYPPNVTVSLAPLVTFLQDQIDAIDTRITTLEGYTHRTDQEIIDLVLNNVPIDIIIACSNETADLTTGQLVTFRLPRAILLQDVRASLTTAAVGGPITVDIKEGGVSILSTLLTIDDGEKSSETAAIAETISDTGLAEDAEITIHVTTIGPTTAGAGLKVILKGVRPPV